MSGCPFTPMKSHNNALSAFRKKLTLIVLGEMKRTFTIWNSKKPASDSEKLFAYAYEVLPNFSQKEYNDGESLPPLPDIISTADFIATYQYHQPDPDMSIINDLPVEIWILIFEYLPHRSQYQAARVCRSFRAVALSVMHRAVHLNLIQPHPLQPPHHLHGPEKACVFESSANVLYYCSFNVRRLVLYVSYLEGNPVGSVPVFSIENTVEARFRAPVELCFRKIGFFHALCSLEVSGMYFTSYHVQQITHVCTLHRLKLSQCDSDVDVHTTVPASSSTLAVVEVNDLANALLLLPFCHPRSLRKLKFKTNYSAELFSALTAKGRWPSLDSITTTQEVIDQDTFQQFYALCSEECRVEVHR